MAHRIDIESSVRFGVSDRRTVVSIGRYCLTIWFDIGEAIRHVANSDGSTHSFERAARINSANSGFTSHLTQAQNRVYMLLLEGLIEKEVAPRLGITIHTVHDHAKAIYKALAVSTRGELLAYSRNEKMRVAPK